MKLLSGLHPSVTPANNTECFSAALTWCMKSVHLHAEVVLEEEEADDGEEVDEKDGQHSRENDGAAVPGHTLYHVEQGLLSDHQVKQLRREREIDTGQSDATPSWSGWS